MTSVPCGKSCFCFATESSCLLLGEYGCTSSLEGARVNMDLHLHAPCVKLLCAMPYNHLSPDEKQVIVNKRTERPFTGEYETLYSPGTFICRRCNNPLYSAEAKFNSGCGWPSFDEEYPDGVERRADADGRRIEIVCAHCGGHLGHVFEGEGFTEKDTRHCVNSLSIRLIPERPAPPPAARARPALPRRVSVQPWCPLCLCGL